ncbi:hypothetical protein GTY83_17950 [Streptomyces sp. SID4928]|uniref:hypothetical protein n=1 Tax=unclassified Streptomyces TaxID=2593676 RepID=UPI0001C1BE80|nr:hypothetical protein [Streptomyces sp. ACT-1]EGE42952.1 hypothetical protein SACT1_3616 [Streptomyces sp. ACT-1]MYR50994.1 hypothetical protein [Streptomyces sp. SID4928]
MGDLANTVAKLEEEAAESRELRSIVERLDTEISFRMETVQEVGGELLELHGSLDDQIAEHDYMAVEQSAASVRGLVDVETVLPAIDAVLLLTALRDDEAIPDLTLPLASFADDSTDDSWDHPRLTQGDLDRVFEAALVRAEERWQEIWGDHLWDDENERDTHREEHRAEAELEAVKERAARAGAHLMALVDHIGDTLWPEVVEAVEVGDRDRAVRALAAANSAGRETEAAYKLYEVNLSIQFEKAPDSIGAMGEFLSDARDWLLSQ